MSEMVERVAKAICRADHIERFGDGDVWRPGELDTKVSNYWHRHISRATAAIAAMREPTVGMIAAAIPALEEVNNAITMAYVHGMKLNWIERGEDPPLKNAWRAMIDAALSEDKPDG